MFLTRKHLSRRTVLKGAGASIALPLLDAMIPAGTAWAQTAAASATRLGFIYFPHGALRNEWEPPTTGRNPKFPFILEPLEPVREYVTVVSGLRNKAGEGGVPHGITQETWLNCTHPRQRNEETGVGVTADQIAARYLQKDTTLPSMEICGEPGGMISFRTPDATAADGRQSAQGVHLDVRAGPDERGAPGDPRHDDEPARLRHRSDGQPESQARRGRPREGRQLLRARSARSSCASRSSGRAANR